MQLISINERVEKIKNSTEDINLLLTEYKPFIASSVNKFTGRFVKYGEDDELSIGLMAFEEAIRAFDSSKGSFLVFAQNIIKRRLIDYFRKENKYTSHIIYNEQNIDEETDLDLSTIQAVDEFSKKKIDEYRKFEIEDLKNELQQWNISFIDLVEASPKHEKTQKIYNEIIRNIIIRPEMIQEIKSKKNIPIAELVKITGIHRKTIERARKYLIAALIIITGDYEYIKDYVDWGF